MSAVRRRLAAPAALAMLLTGNRATASEPAADPAHLAAATRLVDDTGGTARVSTVLGAMRGLMVNILTAHGKDAGSAGKIVDELLLPAFRARVPELNAAFVRFWAGSMTTRELDAADAFFRSPTGRRMIEVQTQSLPALLAASRAWGERVGREVLASQRDALRQRGVSL